MNRRVGENFMLVVPFSRAINPITKTNWEGEGVQPDFNVPAFEALAIAHLQALQAVALKNTNTGRAALLESQKTAAEGALESLRAQHKQESSLPMDFVRREPEGLRSTPAGQVAVEYLAVLNSGNVAAMRRFRERRSSNSGAVAQDYALYRETGGFRIHSVVNSSPSVAERIALLAQRKKDGQWMTLTIVVLDRLPHPMLRFEQQSARPPG
jgi:hypothetical protein